MKIGIVGSRRRTDVDSVVKYVTALPAGSIVVSGGCAGPDQWAATAARARGLEVIEFLPDLSGLAQDGRRRFQATERYYARNQQIAEACDRLVAFVHRSRKGGTEDTIRRAKKLGKNIEIIDTPY